MRFLVTLVLTIIGTAAVLMASPVVASAESGSDAAVPTAVMDAGSPEAAQPGNLLESEEYARREAASPEVQEFAGGDVVVGVSVLVVVVVVLLIILVANS